MAADGANCSQLLSVAPPLIHTKLRENSGHFNQHDTKTMRIIPLVHFITSFASSCSLHTFLCFLPRRLSSRLMWLNSLTSLPRGPLTITVRPFSLTSTGTIEKINRLEIRWKYRQIHHRSHNKLKIKPLSGMSTV